jgi:hypothetical protein
MHGHEKSRPTARQTQLAALEEVLAFLQYAHRVLVAATAIQEVKSVLDQMEAYEKLVKS